MLVIRRDEQTLEEWRPGVTTRRVVSAVAGAETICVIEQRHEPGRGAPTHWHDTEEVVIVREGEAEFWVEGERVRLGQGDAIVLPPKIRHGFVNVGDRPLHVEAVFSSAAPSVTYEEEPETELDIGRAEETHRTPRGGA